MKKLCLILLFFVFFAFGGLNVRIERAFAASGSDTVQILLQVMEKYYSIKITLLDKDKKPIVGAKITLYSTPITKYTDENGIVVFDDVPQGEHRIVVEYDGQIGEQKVVLSGQTESFDFRITLSPVAPIAGPVTQLEKVIPFMAALEKAPSVIQVIMVLILWVSSVVASVFIALLIRAKRKK